LSSHARRTLIKELGFSPLTPTGTYTLHLADPKERQRCVNLISIATVMSMEWTRRSMQTRSEALSKTLVELSEEERLRVSFLEGMAKKQHLTKEAQNIERNLNKTNVSLQEKEDEKEKEEEKEKEKEKEEEKSTPKLVVVHEEKIPIVNDPLHVLKQSNNMPPIDSQANALDEECEWMWAALVLRYQQQRKYDEHVKELMEELDENNMSDTKLPESPRARKRSVQQKELQLKERMKTDVPLPDKQRLDSEGLCHFWIAIDTSEHYDRPPQQFSKPAADDTSTSNSSSSSMKKKKKKKKKMNVKRPPRRRFSCVRNCVYREEGTAMSTATAWDLLAHPLPHHGTMVFDCKSTHVLKKCQC